MGGILPLPTTADPSASLGMTMQGERDDKSWRTGWQPGFEVSQGHVPKPPRGQGQRTV